MVWEDLSKYTDRKYVQQELFDFPEEKPEPPSNLPYFPEPKCDNELLFNLQKAYYEEGDKAALSKTFEILMRIAPKLVNIESKNRQLNIAKDRMAELAEDAVMIFIEAIMKKQLVIRKSFVANLRLQVLRSLFYFTKSMKFEKWLKEKEISFLSLSDYDKMYYKEMFERELEEEKKEKENEK